ncbi:MAG: pyridoxamine 5'-phosphate oxidase family protein, partial [Pseudomonadota bacterium]
AWASDFIRPFMPNQHRAFYETLPFLVLSGADRDGRTWVTLMDGPDGFVRSPDRRTLTLATTVDPQDPLAQSFAAGTDVGMVGIELASRRRNRLSGVIRPDGDGLKIDVRQSFGNCPQYISEREWRRAADADAPEALRSASLSASQIARIRAADTLFIGTGQQGAAGEPSNGFDASHRGGEPGFVQAVDGTRLRIPDYAGNNFFNTIGNILRNPQVGLVFVDFETGGLLQVSGRAEIDWAPSDAKDPAARRMIDLTIEAVVDRPAALSLRWSEEASGQRRFKVVGKIRESEDVASFRLAPVDGLPVEGFEAGQHLPIELVVPGRPGTVKRTYSLSGAPGAEDYRLSVKREPHGVASRFLHDAVAPGDVLYARRPSGEFVVPCSRCPLVLVSAGVGLTPMVAMLHAAAAEPGERPVWYAHAARDGARHALKEEVDALIKTKSVFKRHVVYSRPRAEDRLDRDYDAAGRLTAKTLLALNAGPEARYMLCGPAAFLSDIRSGLEAGGVPADQIHFETFGPTG